MHKVSGREREREREAEEKPRRRLSGREMETITGREEKTSPLVKD